MIYTLTLNPSLDYVVSVKEFQLGKTNRTEEEQIYAGGKGINVSIVLQHLDIESIALGYVSGFTGKEIVRLLGKEGIRTDFLVGKIGESRINFKLKNIEGTEINGKGPVIKKEEIQLLEEKVERLDSEDILFLSGSIPSAMPVDFYAKIMKTLQSKGVLVVLDAQKEALLKALPYRPFLIKPNHHELEDLFGKDIKNQQEVIAYGQLLQKMGAKNVLVSLAGEGAVLITEQGRIITSKAPKGKVLNSVGAGDAMLAGFMAGWMKTQDYEKSLYWGIAAGSATAFSEGLATGTEIMTILETLSG